MTQVSGLLTLHHGPAIEPSLAVDPTPNFLLNESSSILSEDCTVFGTLKVLLITVLLVVGGVSGKNVPKITGPVRLAFESL